MLFQQFQHFTQMALVLLLTWAKYEDIIQSSKYTSTKGKWSKIARISLWNAAGALIKPNGKTMNSYRPSWVLNAVFCTSCSAIRIWWYPDCKSRELNTWAPLSRSRGHLFLAKGTCLWLWCHWVLDNQYTSLGSHPFSARKGQGNHMESDYDESVP